MAYYQRGGAESSSQLWRVLYAANTTKKSKRWIDGFLKAPVLPNNGGGGGALSSPSGRVVLTDLESKTVESCWLKPGDPTIEPGAELTLEHYLVQVEELASTEGRTVDAPIPDSRSPFASQEDAPSSFVSSGLSFVSSISSSQLSATPPVSEHARPAAPPPPPRPFGLSRSQPSHWKPPAASASVPTTIAAAAAQATPRVSSYPVPYGVGARSMLVPAPSALPSQQSGHSSSGRSTHELLAFLGGGASSETPSGTPSAAPAVVSSIARAEPAPLFHQRSLPAPVTSLYAPSPPPSASTFASTSAFSTALPVARPTAAALARLPPRPTGECMQPRVAEPVAHHAVKPANPNPSDFDDLDDLDDIGDLLSAIDGSEPAALTVAPAATQPFAGQPRPLQRPPPAPASSSAVSFRQYQVPSSGRPAPRPPLASEHGPSSSASPLGSSPSQAPFSPSQAPHSASPIAIVSRAAGTDADPGFLANLPEQHPIPLAIAAADECIAEETPKRSARINADFPTLRSYRQTMFSALNETINLQVREKLRLFHLGMKQATLSFLASRPAAPGAHGSRSQDANAVKCRCGKPAVLLMCKKEGANKGRFFHKCGDCQFFAWASSVAKPNTLIASALEQDGTGGTVTIGTPRMLEEYHKAREVALYYNCSLTDSRDGAGSGSSAGASWRGKGRGGGRGGWRGRGRARESAWREYTVNPDESSFSSASRSRGIAVTNSATLFVELSHKSRTTYGRDDLWLVTSRLDFEPSVTVLAKSTFFGPASNLVIELEIIHGSGQSLRQDAVDLGGANVHCIHLGSFSSELTALSCQVTYESIPVLPYLLSEPPLLDEVGVGRNALRRPGPGRGDASSDFGTDQRRMASKSDESRYLFSIGMLYADPAMLSLLLRDFETKYPLNPDQRTVLRACARMFLHPDTSPADLADLDEPDTLDWSQAPSVTLEGGSHSPVLLVHGVFGAGKSFILSVLVVFLASLFEMLQGPVAPGSRQWKVLISSTTNVAVDRIMHGLLGLGYSDFVRVGSVKKIAKTVLPYSANMSKRSDEQDLTDLEHMLRTEALSPDEIQAVRTTIADIKSGTRPTKLVKSRVVGVTCAAATFPCLDGMSFPFIVLDECSQMTEASSLVPISRFGCKRLILVGDPKQLQPTLEGPEAAHPFGLEQTLFERLALQHKPLVMLRTQYRCHPDISAIPNKLFYDNRLLDGVANAARPPIHPRVPTLCFVNVAGQEVQDGDGSYHNDAEVASIVGILRSLLAGVFPNGVLPGERATPDDASGASAAAKHDLDDVDGDHNVDQRVSSRPAKPCGISVDSIGIITPYKSQAIHIKQALDRLPIRDVHGSSLKSILVATADSFQGGTCSSSAAAPCCPETRSGEKFCAFAEVTPFCQHCVKMNVCDAVP
ncbi:hypothetical protein, variant 1 [Capsaspora owczarzaki ATCC 30864]|uniref:GRF-type domain-containing protein n=1 Tax=Capsaspora owczarzaki (strain ATCC 30864) TaxID=595528 RepID=A0A0D2WRG6_CAPO3|nr:hypothetical protein, variant 1 [Capsaspora owczarzaki ATCC 30864]